MNNPARASEFDRKEAQRLARADRRKNLDIPFMSVGSGPNAHLQHGELWFEDGNVIITAQDAWFKLHRGVLAKHSAVFRDMFEVANASAEDDFHGFPMVSVTDSPQHLVLFLMLLYDAGSQPFCTDPTHSIDFQDLRAITLLSFKYDVQYIQEEAIRRLKVAYPETLEGWDARYPLSCREDPAMAQNTVHTTPIDSIAAINLARRFGLDELLPSAFYICAMQDAEDVVARVHYGPDDVEQLSQPDLFRSLRGLTELRQYSHTLCAPGLYVQVILDSNLCMLRNDSCYREWTAVLGLSYNVDWFGSCDALYDWGSWSEDTLKSRSIMCTACRNKILEIQQDLRVGQWMELESRFDICCLSNL